MTSVARMTVVLAALLIAAGSVQADDMAQKFALIASFAFVDYSQSMDMFYANAGYREVNPLLGPYPSKEELIAFGTMGLGISYLASRVLPEAWRRIVVDSIIATERFNIEENRMVYQGWNSDGPPLRGRMMHGIPILVTIRL